ncbi:hypothetical protein QTP70_033349 [Hemibagrus guttatus]|uniref:Protein piccolo-like n=1 Tax=Hemibagrus guttatus TaxID=175788 RepID=A0AAE0RDC2_9TELE|nr:hypothetical protein QTP70_033349 [Hemibagrus guttatus]
MCLQIALYPPDRMFSSNFLGGGNPLSAMSSAVNKFSLFGDETEDGKEKQQKGSLKQKIPEQHGNGQPMSHGSQNHSTEKSPGGRMGDAHLQGIGRGLPQSPASERGSPQQQRAGRGGPHHQGMGRGKSPQHETGKGGPPHHATTGPGTRQGETATASLCPICKNTKLNFQSKEPPNHNTCTKCKSVVCSMCGFSPPDATAKEWLCLNCQMQRALGVEEAPIPFISSKTPTPSPSPVKQSSSTVQKKGTAQNQSLHPTSSEQSKPPEGHKPPGQESSITAKEAMSTLHPQQKPTQQEKGKDSPSPAKSEPPTQPAPKEQSGFFGFRSGGARSRSPSPQPSGSAVSGKVLGFGSSLFSSASNLISSAVQDESSAMQPTSRKASSVSQTSDRSTPPASRKGSEASKDSPKLPATPKQEQKKPEVTQPTKATVDSTKEKLTSSQSPKASQKTLPKSCPICKVDLQKEPPNYNTCTECKTIVCNQCGFNPMPHQSEGKDWLCLTCQTQRALKGVEPQGMKPHPQHPEATTQKKDSTAGSTSKQPTLKPTETSCANQTVAQKEENNKQQLTSTGTKLTNEHNQQTAKTGLSSTQTKPQTKAEPPQEETGFFGFGGVRSRSPSPQVVNSAVSGKVLGFGSSLLSSASNLIPSAVQNEPSTTPPTSRKGSTVSQTSANAANTLPASQKGSEASKTDAKILSETKSSTADKGKTPGHQQSKAPLSQEKLQEHMPKIEKAAQHLPRACPLCKEELRKDPPNYNVCTECKKYVCNLCGFNPMPHQTEVTEWLCLNCQVQRAHDNAPLVSENISGQPHSSPKAGMTPSLQHKDASAVDSTKKISKSITASPQKDDKFEAIQKIEQPNDPPPLHKRQQLATGKPQGDKSNMNKSEAKDESGFFGFGFGGARSRSPSPKPAASAVSGKVLGFGTTFLSSATNLLSSAVNDEPSTTPTASRKGSSSSISSTTPPSSRKGSAVSQTFSKTTPPTSHKGSSVSQTPQKTGSSHSTAVTSHKGTEISHNLTKETKNASNEKAEEKKSEDPQPCQTLSEKVADTAAVEKTSQQLPKTCPLCMTDIRKDLHNYSTCTECKSIMCNLCGFSPMPQETEITEWLCLNCHTRRASGLSSMQSNKIPPTASPQNKKTSVSEQPYKKKDLPDKTILKGLTTAEVKQKEKISAAAAEKQVNQQQSAHRDEEKSQMASKVEPSPAMDKPSQENSGLFGIGGARSRSPSPQPSVSAVTGKVLGFGSSFFSSASNLISSAVQDEASTTPPTSRKDSSVSQSSIRSNTPPSSSRKGSSVTIPQGDSQKKQTDTNKSPIIEKKEEKKPDVTKHQGKDLPNPDKSKLEPTKVKESSHILPKNCPLCKVKIKKDASNYNTCTNCRNIVCIQCGFNPSPHQTERMEWLCLTCQMQQATGAPQQPQPQASKVPVSVSKQNKEPLIPAKDKKSLADGKLHDNQSEAEKKQDSSTIKHTVQSQHPKQQTQQTKDGLSKPAKSEPPKKESDFFGFGRRSRSPSPQPAHSGKVLGFGSSIFSAASNLLSSAVQDGTTPTPSTSRKGSTVSQTSENAVPTVPDSSKRSEVSNTIPASSKVSSQDSTKENSSNVTKLPTKHDEERKIQEMKSEVESSKSVLAPILKDTTPSDATKTTETTQLLPKVCPLCKVEIKKEPPNYSICTECKNAVCNLCGFNPMPDKTEMKEWLCLNCQIQRTSGSLKPTQTKPINVPMPASPKKDVQAKVSLQNLSPKQGSKGDTSAKPVLSQTETIRDKSGFGLTHDQSPQPATIKEKGLGFGSSIISTASDLISSAVQDKTSITAPNSHKSSAVSEESVKASTPPASCKVPVVSKKDLHPNETKSISQKPGSEEKMSALQTSKEESVEVKEGVSLSACPLCKEKFQNNPPNFSTCTSCKMTVCNFCGFNPMPDQTEVKEWLCLNCQMQQLSGASPAQTQAKNILPLEPEESPVASQKKSIIPVDVTDKNKILSEVGKSEDQPLVPASQNPTTPAKFPQPSKDEPLKDDTVSAISQTSAKAASVLPASVETLISGKTKSQTVQKQKEIKPADQAPNAQSAKAPSALEKGEISLSKLQKDCPICNEKLKKDPTNYNTCDSCKAIVCNLCGGMNSRADITEKNWLCVNCQKQQAPGPPPAKAKEEFSYRIREEHFKSRSYEEKDKRKKPLPSVAEPKPSLVDSVELQSAVPSEKQSGIFGFSFGGTKSQPPSQPAASAVSGRVLGFGSSFLSSASNLISSAVQDEPSITPPTSRKGSTISLKNASTPPFSRKSSAAQQHEEKKETENKLQDQLAKETPPLLKKETACLELYKACPLCKADLKNDPPNYNTCTQCKNIVCNLCGFSPIPQETEETTSFMDQQVSEWLCLSCQIQRAPGPPPAKTQSEVKKVPSPVLPKKKETPAAGSPLKNPSLPVNAKDEKPSGVIKPVDKPITAETQEPPAPSTQPSTAKSAPPQKVEPTKEESSLFGFSFSGTRSRPASPQPGISAVSGKVLGFGSSFLSSASNLISSAVQHEPSTTPPTSRKGSTTSQTSVKMTSSPSTSHKKQVEKIESETNVEVQLPKADTPLSESLGTCTICKADLKIDPPNYTTCTECKKTVCNLCGFSPVPQETKVKKWLCLDCHKQHAPRPPPILPQLEANNLPSPAPKQEGQTTDDPQTEPSLSVDATMKAAENVKKDDKSSRAESQTPTAVQSAQQSSPDTPAIPKKPESSNKEKSFFSFSTGGDKSPAPQPDISAVSGKTRGFGASFFSSASNLISSARQDEPSTTPPTSRKGSTISQQSEKDTPTAHTLDKESKEQKEEGKTALKMTSDDKTAVPPSIVEKDEHLNKPLKACPLCKVALTKDPPNCDTCTECKAIVCHLCGFSPILQQTQVKEWLCLNCQIQRAPGAPSTQPQQQANKVPPPASPQQKAKYLAGNPEDKPTQVETKKTISTPTKQQSTAPTTKGDPSKKESGFFGFGGARSRSPSPQPAVSAVSGKVLGFGSSLFSTASNIISSAVHDEPTTPPTPRKGSATSQTSVKSIPVTPTSSQKEPVEPEKHHTKKTTKEERPVAEKHENKLNEKQIKTTKVTGESPKVEEPSKHQNVACPLCKIALNVGSTEAPNYNTCTECKDTVCNLCGFNPIPHQSEVYEWLCLNCQTQRTLKGIEPQKPQAKPDIVSTSTLSSSNITPKTATDANETSTKDLCEMQGPHKDVPAATQNKASNLTPVQSDNISNTGTTQVKDIINDKVVKKAQEKETFADTKVGAPTKDMHSSKGTAIIEDQKSAVSQKPGIDQEPTAKPSDNNSEIKSVLEKSEQKQSKSSAPEVEIPKEESGFFGFGFGSGKSQSTPSKPSDTRTGKLFGFGGLTEAPSQQSAPSVSGKVLGFGSSIFSSASNLISSAVNDEPSRTPPSPRKGSTVSQTSIKSATTPSSRKGSTVSQASLKTPPTSRKGSAASETSLKTSPIGDTKPSDSEKQAEKETDDMSKVKLDGASSEPSKPPDLEKHIEKTPDDKSEIKSAPLQSASKMEQSSCPICKVQLNVASEGLPNFNTCTKCNNNVCNQCGFDPMPNQTTVKQWLCMNCQKQRVEGGVEPTGSSVINPHPTLPKKDQQLATSDHKLVETSTVRVDGKTSSIPETAKKGHQKPSLNEDVPPSNKELPQQKVQEQKDEKSQKQMKKGPDSPARSNPPSQTEVPKQQSSFFGFGVSTGKSQPTPSKSSESTTGKLFGFAGLTETARSRSPSPQSMTNAPGKFLGFGSTIFSSASNLISSALQDESSPPLSRKGSTVSQSSTPPTSRKGSIVPTAEPKAPISKKLDDKPVEKKIEEPNETKDKSSVSEKQEAMPESVEVTVLPKSPFKASQPTCPLCKVDLNVGSKELPNYNTCTECKDVVCNLCGFNPMPHLAEINAICKLSLQFPRAHIDMAVPDYVSQNPSQLTHSQSPDFLTDEVLDYSKKGTELFSGITTIHSSQEISSGNNTLKSSYGVVHSSVATPIPSSVAITTQPGSIFSTTCNSLITKTEPSTQIKASPYDIMSSTECNRSIYLETDPSKDILPSAIANLLPSISAFPELYSDATLEVIAASLDALVSPNFPTFDDSKSQQYQAEHEFLQLEKLKQLCLAEELEWERQEIQRYREQEQFIVQKELEELQSIKQQLLMQQEEERKAHLILQQETFAQQQLQLEQIQLLQQQLHQQLQEQKIYPYSFDGISHTTSSGIVLDSQYCRGDNGQYWPVKDDNTLSKVAVSSASQDWHSTPSGDLLHHSLNIPKSEDDVKETEEKKQDSEKLPAITKQVPGQNAGISSKKISSTGAHTDEEEVLERTYPGRRRRSRKSVDSCMQTDDEDQNEWDAPVRSRRRSRSSRYADGERLKGSKVSSIAIQTVAEISVQTDHSGTLKRSPVRAQVDTTFDLHRGGEIESDSDFTSDKDKKHSTPIEVGVNTHLKADGISICSVPKSPKVLYSPVSPVSPGKGSQKMLMAEPPRHPSSPRSLKTSQRSLSDPKSLSPTTDDRIMYQYSDASSSKGSQSSTPVGTHKKIKRTLPHPPPDEDTIVGPLGYSTGSSRRRVCRNTTMARAKILQDIDKELDLVERESSKLRKKQAELDEEEKEIDAKLRYLEMGINRRKEALLKEREKRERAYLQGVAEERDYMSDSEVSNNRETRGNGHGLERPRTAPQSEFNQFIPPQTEADSQYAQLAYSHYQYASQSDSPSHYSQQTLYQQPSLYHQHVSPYQTQSIYSSVPTLSQQSQQTGFDHASQLLLMQQKTRQTTLSDLEPKITTNYEVIRNQPLLIAPTSTESAYGVSHLTSKYNNLDLRIGLEERGSMASSPMSSISAESFYADIDHHNVRNYVMIDDIGELTKGSRGLDQSFNVPDKDISKTDRLLRVADVRRTTDVTDFIGPLQASSRLHSYGKPEEDSMEEPYELKLLKQQIKQEFRRGTESLEQLTGLPHYLHSESFRHFPKSEKYSIGRLTLEKQAAKQLSASVLYQKQLKNKRTLIDPKITKFSPIQESRDLEPDYSSFLSSTGSPMGGLSSRARLLQDEITFGLRKNLAEQQKYLGSTLSANLAQSLNLGHSLNLGQSLRSSIQDDGTYPSGTRSRPSSRPSSVYGLDLSIKRDLSSSSLRLKSEGDGIDSQFGIARVKPTSLPISQSRGRIPIVAQNSEEESPLSPVGQPMGMARASAGPLPPISADSRDQFGSSHSLPEVQQHMREESRTRGYDRDIAFIMDDLQGAMSDSEAYHLQHEETDWFDKPREGHSGSKPGQDKRQVKGMHYPFPYTRIKLQRDPKDHSVSGGGFGIHVVGGKEIPGTNGEIGAYIANLAPAGTAELSGKFIEAMEYHKQRAYMKNHIFHL